MSKSHFQCNLQRHPECSNLKQWKGGTVKIDPLALVQAIERYLVVRGYGGIRADSEDDSEEDMDDNVAAVIMNNATAKHKLQFMIGDHVLPYNMTVYQAVKQFSPLVTDQSETDTDTETPIGNASIWVQQHTIYYRPVEEEASSASATGQISNSKASSSAGASSSATAASSSSATTTTATRKGSGKNSYNKLSRKKVELWMDGAVPQICSPLYQFLTVSLPGDVVTIQDAALDALCMLRIVNALNRHWTSLYATIYAQTHLIPQSEFIHPKVSAILFNSVQPTTIGIRIINKSRLPCR